MLIAGIGAYTPEAKAAFANDEKREFHRQADQQYSDLPFERVLNEYENAKDKEEDFFSLGIWENARPETKLNLIHTIVENGTINNDVLRRIGQTIEDCHDYPAAVSLLQTLIQKYPYDFLESVKQIRENTLQEMQYQTILFKQWKKLNDYQKFGFLAHMNQHLNKDSTAMVFEQFIKEYTESRNADKSIRVRYAQKRADEAHSRKKITTDALKNVKRNAGDVITLLKRDEFKSVLNTLTEPQLTYLLQTRIQQPPNEYNREFNMRDDIIEVLEKTDMLTDNEKLDIHQQIDQQYPDPPLEEVLSEYANAKNKEGFFWKDVWKNANPETKIETLLTIIKDEETEECIQFEIMKVIQQYYFYPETDNLINIILTNDPTILLEGKYGTHNLSPKYIKKIAESISLPTFIEHIGTLTYMCTEEESLGDDYIKKEIERRMPGTYDLFKTISKKQKLPKITFLTDPAISLFSKISEDAIPKEHTEGLSKTNRMAYRLMIARYFHYQGIQDARKITKGMVVQASNEIMQKRAEIRNMKLIKDRNVVYIAGSENGMDWVARTGETANEQHATSEYTMPDIYRFGKDATIEEINKQGALSCKRFRVDQDIVLESHATKSETLAVQRQVMAEKQKGLDAVVQTLEKLTIIIDGHGTLNGTLLIGGFNEAVPDNAEWKQITTQDLAETLAKRWEIIQQRVASGEMTWEEALEPVIIIFHSCNSQNQLRGLYQALDDIDSTIPKPIAKSVTEWKQFGYSNPSSRFGSKALEGHILQTQPHQKGPATIGGTDEEIKKKNPLYKKSILNIWFRDKQNRPMQISTEDWDAPIDDWMAQRQA